MSTEQQEVQYVLKLHPVQLEKLEQLVRADIVVTHQTTELQAGYMLGIQKVLNTLRTELT